MVQSGPLQPALQVHVPGASVHWPLMHPARQIAEENKAKDAFETYLDRTSSPPNQNCMRMFLGLVRRYHFDILLRKWLI